VGRPRRARRRFFCVPGCVPAVAVCDADRVRAGAGGREIPCCRCAAVRAPGVSPRLRSARAAASATGSTSRHGDWRCSWRRASSRARAGCCWNITDRRPGRRAPGRGSRAFWTRLAAQGAFCPAPTPTRVTSSSAMSVSTGRRLSPKASSNLLFGFASSTPGVFDTWLVTHRAGASRVRPVVSETAPRPRKHRVEWEIENRDSSIGSAER